MSIVFLHVGQAGNQIGAQLWSSLLKEQQFVDDISLEKRQARGILVDTEPKVVQKIIGQPGLSDLFRVGKNALYTQNGRGNNWALGYSKEYKEVQGQKLFGYGEGIDKKLYEEVIELLRTQAERADYFQGVLLFHSLAGGTGSGLGSRLIEAYRDNFSPSCQLATVSIWPSMAGETPLQQYNTCLSLATLQQNADACLLFQNDHLLKLLSKTSSTKKSSTPVSMHNLNEYIASCLEKVIMQTHTGYRYDFSQILTQCAPMNAYKMLEVSCNPFTFNGQTTTYGDNFYGDTYESVLDGLVIQQPLSTEVNCTIASLVYLRTVSRVDLARAQISKKLLQKFKPVPWNDECIKVVQVKAPESDKMKNSIAQITNRSQVAEPLQSVLESAQQKFKAKAYMHWYRQHGVEEEKFAESFETVQQMIQDYTQAKM